MTTTVFQRYYAHHGIRSTFMCIIMKLSCGDHRGPFESRADRLHEGPVPNLPSEVAACAIYEQIRQDIRVSGGKMDPRQPLQVDRN